LGLPGVSYPKGADASPLLGWRDLARKIDRIDKEIQDSQGIKPLVVGMDKCYITSELIFYRNKQGKGREKKELLSYTTGRHLFGMDSLMYRYWFPEARVNQFRNENSILWELRSGTYRGLEGHLSTPQFVRAMAAARFDAHMSEHDKLLARFDQLRGLPRDQLCETLKAWYLDHAVQHDAQLKAIFQAM
jgi:hypothetical protein